MLDKHKNRVIIESILMISIGCLIVYLAAFYGREESKVYPCHLAEISVDYPAEVKQMCRRLVRKAQE